MDIRLVVLAVLNSASAISARWETLANLLLGASVLSWGVLGLTAAEPGTAPSAVRWVVFVLNLCVAVAFWVRRPARLEGSGWDIVQCLPSFAICGLAFGMAQPTADWPHHAEIVFALGAAIAVSAIGCLGRCFAFFPAVRGTVSLGPYRFIRHPAYAGEALMVLGCLLANPSAPMAAVVAGLIPCLVVRVAVEERLLRCEPSYLRYCRAVRWRILPGLW